MRAEWGSAVFDGEFIAEGEATYELIKGVREDHGAEGEIVEVCEGGSMVVDGFCDAIGRHRRWWRCQFRRGCVLHGHDWVCDFTGKAYDSSGAAELLDAVEL